MDEFLNPYWDLNQLCAWMKTRSADIVRFAAPAAEDAKGWLEIATECGVAASRLRLQGRDLDEELWHTSGWAKPNLAQDRLVELLGGSTSQQNGDDNLPLDETRETIVRQLQDQGKIRLVQYNFFPALEYALHLLQLGKIQATGNTPGEPKPRRIEPLELAGAKIDYPYGLKGRLAIWPSGIPAGLKPAYFEHVYVSRGEIMSLFSAERSLEELFREAANQSPDGTISTHKGMEIAEKNGLSPTRAAVMDTIVALGIKGKQGRKKKNQNAA